jgi:hypothetical protein
MIHSKEKQAVESVPKNGPVRWTLKNDYFNDTQKK